MTRWHRIVNQAVRLAKRQTILSTDGFKFFRLPAMGRIPRSTVNRLDYHNPAKEWIGTTRRVQAEPGAAFGKPTAATSKAVYWRDKLFHPERQADTQPKRRSLDPARSGLPPNPGRPELGGRTREQ